MEKIITLITQNWSTILEYALMFVAYFLVFLYKNKITATKQHLSTLFKERTKYIDTTDEKLRKEIEAKLVLAESKYIDAVNKIKGLEQDLIKTKETLNILLNEEVDYEL